MKAALPRPSDADGLAAPGAEASSSAQGVAGLRAAFSTDAWFASCPIPLTDALLALGRLRRLNAGALLFGRGDGAQSLCCVVAGALRVGNVQADGSELLLAYLEPYQWFGEISLIDGAPRTHDVRADGDTQVLVVPGAGLLDWLAAHPQHWRDLARLGCAKLRATFGVLEDIALLPLEPRLARRLWLVASGYGARGQQAHRHVRLPQEQLALMLGVSRQSVNKALRALERRGVIALRYGGIELLDLEALQAASSVVRGA